MDHSYLYSASTIFSVLPPLSLYSSSCVRQLVTNWFFVNFVDFLLILFFILCFWRLWCWKLPILWGKDKLFLRDYKTTNGSCWAFNSFPNKLFISLIVCSFYLDRFMIIAAFFWIFQIQRKQKETQLNGKSHWSDDIVFWILLCRLYTNRLQLSDLWLFDSVYDKHSFLKW